MTSALAYEEVSRCIIQMLLEEPFYGHLLSGVVRSVSDTIPTLAVAAVDGQIRLVVNEQFFLESIPTAEQRVGVIKHETLHLLFRHLFRVEPRHDRLLYNLAADLVVNQYIGRWPLPDTAVRLASFPDLQLLPEQTLQWYYERLLSAVQNSAAAPLSAAAIERFGSGLLWHSDHSSWRGADDGVGVQQSELDRLIAQAWARVGQRHGALPGRIEELISLAVARRTPAVDWRRTLRLFACSSRRTRIAHTIRRRSKRYGTLPGIKVKRHQRLVVAIDTSGSVSDRDLELLFTEVHGIWRQGAEITVVECDAQVQKTWPYRGKPPEVVHGRGGTVFDPVFEYLRQQRRIRFDGCIYLTDGFADAPTIRPRCPVLWVVTADGDSGGHLRWGRAVKLPGARDSR